MDKEEIKKGKAHLEWLIDNGILPSEDEPHIENILKYINNLEITNKTLDTECSRLEKKESILDKVTDKLKEYLKLIKQDGIYGYDTEIREILNIIEGEKEK